jgi:hypothetical protein
MCKVVYSLLLDVLFQTCNSKAILALCSGSHNSVIVSGSSAFQKRGPQRSVDVIVSASFLITLLLLSFLSVECLKVSLDTTMPHVVVEVTGLQSSAFVSRMLVVELTLLTQLI